ncbi:MAG: hypothetical protein Q8R47_02290 [Nanoarchaeota archaeon]|nr:hypothetical protein [Nanoarchaeota archaeon]
MNPQNYLSIYAMVAAMGCAPAALSAKVPTPAPEPREPDCRSLDLTKKVGFSASFEVKGAGKFCYHIAQKEKHFFDELYQCDEQQRPVPEHFMVMREFAGPRKDAMQINAVLAVDGKNMDYVPFWRDPSGSFSSVPDQPLPQPELEDMFYKGRKMLDNAKRIPQVCKELLDYRMLSANDRLVLANRRLNHANDILNRLNRRLNGANYKLNH